MSHKKNKKNKKEIWEEMGIDPDLPFEEKVKLLEKKEKNPESDQKHDVSTDDLPF